MSKTNVQYKVTRKFLSGVLKGLTYTEVTPIYMPIGFTCKKPIGGSAYTIIACERV